LIIFNRSHAGWVRAQNEDYLDRLSLGGGYELIVVADGMGGHKSGEIASRLAVSVITETVRTNFQPDPSVLPQLLRESVLKANAFVYASALEDVTKAGMGTTVDAVLLGPNGGHIAHVGDGRVYRYAENVLTQLTEDHSYVAELMRQGALSEEEAERHPKRHVILRAVGTDEVVQVDMIHFPWRAGDRLLICTDGFSNHMSAERLKTALADRSRPLETIGEELFEEALKNGGDDNLTLVMLEALPSQTVTRGGAGVWN